MLLIMTAIMSVIHNMIIVMQNLQAAMLDHGWFNVLFPGNITPIIWSVYQYD